MISGVWHINSLVVILIAIMGGGGATLIWSPRKADTGMKLGWMLLCGAVLSYLLAGYLAQVDAFDEMQFSTLSVWFIGFSTLVSLIYSVAVVRPVWLKRGGVRMVFTCYALLTAGNIAYAYFLVNPVSASFGASMCGKILLGVVVWAHYLYFLATVLFVAYVGWMVIGLIPHYEKYAESNYANVELFKVGWLGTLLIVVIELLLLNIIEIVFHGLWVSVVTFIGIMAVWVFVIGKAQFQETFAIPTEFNMVWTWGHGWQEVSSDDVDEMELIAASSNGDEVIAEVSDRRTTKLFDSEEISRLSQVIDEWMKREKPYLRNDFRLNDVLTVIPRNRSYISAFFNEGLGKPFAAFVQEYRIQESIELMNKHRSWMIKDIAYAAGFSSPAVFTRSFTQCMGQSPVQYRSLLK